MPEQPYLDRKPQNQRRLQSSAHRLLVRVFSAEERKANIRLIAAAPDMLEALIMCKDRLETLFDADEATEADIMVLGVVTNVIDAALYKL